MAGRRQPIELVQAKGNKHLTNSEIEERKALEVHAPADAVRPPSFLSTPQKREFRQIAGQMIDIGIMTNLDCVALGQYIASKDEWIRYTRLVERLSNPRPPNYITEPGERERATQTDLLANMDDLERVTSLQDKAFKRCRACAMDMGLTISSRCKLVVPKASEKTDSKWDKYKGAGSG